MSKSTRRRATFIVMSAILAAACRYRVDRECVSERGCPEPGALQTCGPAPSATPVGDFLAARALPPLDRPVRLSGELVRTETECTQLLCDSGNCCNGCGASMGLADPGTRKVLELAADRAGRWTCGGDDSGVCCGAPTGVSVEIEGRFVLRGESIEGPVYQFSVVEACRP